MTMPVCVETMRAALSAPTNDTMTLYCTLPSVVCSATQSQQVGLQPRPSQSTAAATPPSPCSQACEI